MRSWSYRSVVKLHRVLLMAAIAGALAPAASLASFPGANGVIAYSAEHSIWAVDPNTGNQLRLTSGSNDSDPSFSASGNMLAFQRWEGATATVYLARADGSDAKPLVSGGQPAFSPSGQQIAFVRAGGLFLTGLAPGSPVQQITDHPGDRAPQWSPTGSIVFERTDVWRVQYRGRIEHPIRSELDLITPPSLDVRRLLTNGPIRYKEYVCRDVSCSRSRVRLTYGKGTDMWPDWSPDGKALSVTVLFGCDLAVNGLPPMTHVLATSSKVAFHFSCFPSGWAPQGRGLAEAGLGALAGSRLTSCPAGPDYESPISWQPLLLGTLPVPTVPCGGTLRPVSIVKAESVEAPPTRTRSCTVRHHKRKCKG
jgi:hypothetical protein